MAVMKYLFLAASLLATSLLATPARAEEAQPVTTTGGPALMLAMLVAQSAPGFSVARRAALAAYADGRPAPGPVIGVRADSVQCRAGGVDITRQACDLKFGARTATLSGRRAHELHATLAEIGVAPEGAMGSVYIQADKIRCTITPVDLAARAGAGAVCVWIPVSGGER